MKAASELEFTPVNIAPEKRSSRQSCLQTGENQKEELDLWRAAGERGPDGEDESAGRNLQGFSLPRAFRRMDQLKRPSEKLW